MHVVCTEKLGGDLTPSSASVQNAMIASKFSRNPTRYVCGECMRVRAQKHNHGYQAQPGQHHFWHCGHFRHFIEVWDTQTQHTFLKYSEASIFRWRLASVLFRHRLLMFPRQNTSDSWFGSFQGFVFWGEMARIENTQSMSAVTISPVLMTACCHTDTYCVCSVKKKKIARINSRISRDLPVCCEENTRFHLWRSKNEFSSCSALSPLAMHSGQISYGPPKVLKSRQAVAFYNIPRCAFLKGMSLVLYGEPRVQEI